MMILTERAEEQRGGWAWSGLEKALAELSRLHRRDPFGKYLVCFQLKLQLKMYLSMKVYFGRSIQARASRGYLGSQSLDLK